MSLAFLGRYPALIDQIERQFPVTAWRGGDVDIWPLARLELYLDMYWQEAGSAPAVHAFVLRAGARMARPWINRWKTRRDRAHYISRPRKADTVFLGDGVSLDRVDGTWQDRFGEPLMVALERRGQSSFLMQNGDLSRLPWRRKTFPANLIEATGWLRARPRPLELPGHQHVMDFLRRNGVRAPSLEQATLARRAAVVSATAKAFEALLEIVRPRLAFVVSHYANLGPAFVLACRRQGILSVDLQHAPLAGAPMGYGWSALPRHGYTTLPALFWNWSQADAAKIRAGFQTLEHNWHCSLQGGHVQLGSVLNERNFWEAKYRAIAGGTIFAREILVTLQPVDGHLQDWEMLAAQVEAAPVDWRWWIRRHPASRPHQDAAFGRLLKLSGPNVIIGEAAALPLPVLLSHMSVLVSLASGAAEEAAMFGVPAFFLSGDAVAPFSRLIDEGQTRIVDINRIASEIVALPNRTQRPFPEPQPSPEKVLFKIDEMARDYAALCESSRV
jgi:hypothetical protein